MNRRDRETTDALRVTRVRLSEAQKYLEMAHRALSGAYSAAPERHEPASTTHEVRFKLEQVQELNDIVLERVEKELASGQIWEDGLEP
jgi:hypothetical protein